MASGRSRLTFKTCATLRVELAVGGVGVVRPLDVRPLVRRFRPELAQSGGSGPFQKVGGRWTSLSGWSPRRRSSPCRPRENF